VLSRPLVLVLPETRDLLATAESETGASCRDAGDPRSAVDRDTGAAADFRISPFEIRSSSRNEIRRHTHTVYTYSIG
jgi:hypothetical protein